MQSMAEIIDNKQIADHIFDMTVWASDVANAALPGQFAHIRVRNSIDPLLRRPISICDVNRQRGTVRFIYRSHGVGTQLLSDMRPGQGLDMIAPLGNGAYPLNGDYQHVYLIGGGIGVPPLLYAAKEWSAKGANVHVILGFAGRHQVILERDFKQYGNVHIYTIDGGYGTQGLVTDYFNNGDHLQMAAKQDQPSAYFACGPKPMLRALKEHASLQGVRGYLSLEEHMACGIGACMGCVTKVAADVQCQDGIRAEQSSSDRADSNEWKYAKVCDCGPVFLAEKVVL